MLQTHITINIKVAISGYCKMATCKEKNDHQYKMSEHFLSACIS